MTDKETFDKVARHLLTQGAKAEDRPVRGGQRCCYRSSAGLKCAVGCLIPDEEYKPEMEGDSLYDECSLVTGWAAKAGYNTRLLASLQTAHDQYEPADWPVKLLEIASRYGLSSRVVAELSAKDRLQST